MAAFTPIVDFLKKLHKLEEKHLQTSNDEFQKTFDFIENAYDNAVTLFSSGKAITYPKVPSTVRTTKRRTELSQGNKENKKNKQNTDHNEAQIPEEEEPNSPPVRRTRRFTRLQNTRQADLSPDQVFVPQTATKPKKSSKQSNIGQPKCDVLKKVKEYEEKVISPILKKVRECEETVSPSLNATPERHQPTSVDKVFVSTLSPVKLVDKKLTTSPYVLCTPIDHKFDLAGPSKTIRRSASMSLDKRRVSGAKKSLLNTYVLNGHGTSSTRTSIRSSRRLSHRSSIGSSHLKNEIAGLVKESEEIDEADSESEDDEVAAPKKEIKSTECESSYEESESEDKDDVIPKTPTPPRKRIQKNASNSRSTQKVRSHSGTSGSSGSRQVAPTFSNRRVFGTPASVTRVRLNSSGRFLSPKIIEARLIRQKQEALEIKEEKSRQAMKSRSERERQKAEELKRLRAKKLQQVIDKRRRQEQEKKAEQLVKIAAKDKPRERSRVTPSKSSTRLQEKAIRAEERRSKEEELRRIKLQEREEEMIQYREQCKKKNEMELLKQQERLAEQRKIQLEKQELKEMEEKRRVELHKQRLEEEEAKKKKELELQRLKEVQRQAAEIDKQRERERIAREKAEMERLMAREKVEQTEEAKKEIPKSALNTTFTQPKPPNADCYDMTPEVIKQPVELKDPDNYDIADLNSEDSTDDERNPRKHIPKWAQHYKVRVAVMRQLQDVNFESFFSVIDLPNLRDIFNKDRARYGKRGSSAIWVSPYKENLSFQIKS